MKRVQKPKQYVLFTMSSCGQCTILKNRLGNRLQNITEVDLYKNSNNANTMELFYTVSPQRAVPALAIISDGRVENTAVGTASILQFF